jgi:hypothetical protein
MWGDAAQRSDHFALRRIGYLLQFRDHQDFDTDAGDEELIGAHRETPSEKYLNPNSLTPEFSMARETTYFVQAFNAGKGGNLKADAPISCKSANGALRTAERLALRVRHRPFAVMFGQSRSPVS